MRKDSTRRRKGRRGTRRQKDHAAGFGLPAFCTCILDCGGKRSAASRGCRRLGSRGFVAQVSKPAVSRVSKPAGRWTIRPLWWSRAERRLRNRRYSRLGNLRYHAEPPTARRPATDHLGMHWKRHATLLSSVCEGWVWPKSGVAAALCHRSPKAELPPLSSPP
jgi:hypothetical protein